MNANRHPLENRIPPPMTTVLLGGFMWALSLLPPSWAIPQGLRWPAAMFFTMLGAMLPASGFCTFGRAKTTIDPVRPDSASTLVRSGVYRYTRNPRYVGFTLLLTGFAVFLASPWAAPGPFMFAAFTTRFQILPEERALRSKFGADYERCLEATRRWF